MRRAQNVPQKQSPAPVVSTTFSDSGIVTWMASEWLVAITAPGKWTLLGVFAGGQRLPRWPTLGAHSDYGAARPHCQHHLCGFLRSFYSICHNPSNKFSLIFLFKRMAPRPCLIFICTDDIHQGEEGLVQVVVSRGRVKEDFHYKHLLVLFVFH